jgi:hypothetical protein
VSVVCVTLYHLPGALSSRSVECAITFRIFMMPNGLYTFLTDLPAYVRI